MSRTRRAVRGKRAKLEKEDLKALEASSAEPEISKRVKSSPSVDSLDSVLSGKRPGNGNNEAPQLQKRQRRYLKTPPKYGEQGGQSKSPDQVSAGGFEGDGGEMPQRSIDSNPSTPVGVITEISHRVMESESKAQDAFSCAKRALDTITGHLRDRSQEEATVKKLEEELRSKQQDVDTKLEELQSKIKTLDDLVKDTNEQIKVMSPMTPKGTNSRLVKLNVGGTIFETRRATLEDAEGTYFSSLFSGRFTTDVDADGNIFIDRDPRYFPYFLNWLRDRSFSSQWPLNEESFFNEARFYSLTKYMFGDLLFMAYGYDGTRRLDTIECYNPLTDKWKQVAKMPTCLSSPSCAALGEYLYMTGGKNNDNQAVGTVTRFHPRTKQVIQVAQLGTLRFGHGLVVLNGSMYAVGGYGDDGGRVRSVERYDEATNKWYEVTGLNSVRSALGCAVLDGHIYVAGGYGPSQPNTHANNHKLSSVERYDPKTNKWTLVKPLGQARAHVCLIGYQGKLWAIGGYDGEHASQRVECYDPATDEWTNGPSLLEKRSVVVCSVVGSKLYAVGGYDGQAYLRTTEIFDPELNSWLPGPTMPGNRGRHCVCSLPFDKCV